MLGQVYMLKIQGRFRNDPHPHVVVLESAYECLVVPCFSSGGEEVEDVILDEQSRSGTPAEALRIDLDNSTCVKWKGRSAEIGNRSSWLPFRVKRFAKSNLPQQAHGQMCDECLEDILRGVVAFKNRNPRLFSVKSNQGLDATLAQVREKIAAKSAQRGS